MRSACVAYANDGKIGALPTERRAQSLHRPDAFVRVALRHPDPAELERGAPAPATGIGASPLGQGLGGMRRSWPCLP